MTTPSEERLNIVKERLKKAKEVNRGVGRGSLWSQRYEEDVQLLSDVVTDTILKTLKAIEEMRGFLMELREEREKDASRIDTT